MLRFCAQDVTDDLTTHAAPKPRGIIDKRWTTRPASSKHAFSDAFCRRRR
jgi:hypothetical protein